MALYDRDKVQSMLASGQLKPEKLTGLVYMTKDGTEKEVVITGQKGKPSGYSKTKKAHGWWSEEKKIEACTLHAATGNLSNVARLTKIPEGTLRKWKEEEWWMVCQSRIRREKNEEHDKKFTDIVDKALDKIVDRIENGDYMYDIKRGVAVPVPVSARDLSIVAGTIFDKRQLLRGEATKISKAVNTEEHLNMLADKFIAAVKQKGVGMREPVTLDNEIEDAELVTDTSVKE